MDTVSNCFLRSNAISSAPGCSSSPSAPGSCSAVQVSSPMILRTLLLPLRSCWLLLLACPCKLSAAPMTASLPRSSWPRFSPPASGLCLSTAMSLAGTGGATEVCDAILLSMRARHASECVPVPFWHLGQPIVTPNFFTIASVMYTLRTLAVIGVFAMSVQSSPGCGGSAAGSSASAAAVPAACAAGAWCPNTATRLKASGGEVRPTGLMSQERPATSRITSRLHLLLSGSRRTALNLLAPR